MEHLIKGFKKVGLILKIVNKPLRNSLRKGADLIFQLDIERIIKGYKRWEQFRIYPGHKDNLIQIRDTDPSSKQLLLMVKEPAGRTFEDSIKITQWNTKEQILEALERNRNNIVKEITKKSIIVTTKVPEEVRYFLMGVDERQLFIAELQESATTVNEARRSLGKTIQFADGKRKGSIPRQGEWFFLETSTELRRIIENSIKKNLTAIQKNMAIGEIMGRSGGNPHTVDELVTLPNEISKNISSAGASNRVLLRKRVFIRGRVRHKDHTTKKFNHWREVIANNEGSTASGGSSGVFWID